MTNGFVSSRQRLRNIPLLPFEIAIAISRAAPSMNINSGVLMTDGSVIINGSLGK